MGNTWGGGKPASTSPPNVWSLVPRPHRMPKFRWVPVAGFFLRPNSTRVFKNCARVFTFNCSSCCVHRPYHKPHQWTQSLQPQKKTIKNRRGVSIFFKESISIFVLQKFWTQLLGLLGEKGVPHHKGQEERRSQTGGLLAQKYTPSCCQRRSHTPSGTPSSIRDDLKPS